MSEKAPRTNPRLENFEAKQAEADQKRFEDELYGNAGTTDFSPEARTRVEEADAYERHMEQLANETRSDYDRGLDRDSDAYGREWEEAEAENEAFDARINDAEARQLAESEAFEAKIANDPLLRMADKISRELHELRNKEIDPDTADIDEQRAADLNARLDDLTDRYLQSDNYDADVAAYLIDREDTTARKQAGERALVALESDADKKESKKDTDDSDIDLDLGDLPAIPKSEKKDDEDDLDTLPAIPASGADKKDADIDLDLDALPAIPSSEKSSTDDDDDDLDKLPAIPSSEKTDGDEPKNDAEKKSSDDDTTEIPAVKVEEKKSLRERSREAVRGAYANLYARYTLGKGDVMERYRGNRKATWVALGTVAATAAAIAIWYGIDHNNAKDVADANNNGAGFSGGGNGVENAPGAKGPIVPNIDPTTSGIDYSDAARTVTSGEGWYQTMAEAGITNSTTQAEILRNDGVMQQLADMGLAYRDPDLGGWGMNMPANGRMPKEALDILANAAK